MIDLNGTSTALCDRINDRIDRAMKALAVALRICANSRTTPKQAGKEKTPAVTPSKRKMYRG